MNRWRYLALFVLIAIFSACDKEDDVEDAEPDYLIFGYSYGACAGGGCVGTYKLTDNKLFEDLNHNFSRRPYNFIELGKDKYEKVKDLEDFIPPKLLTETDTIFGSPGADGGILHIEYKENRLIRKWWIDQRKANVPEYLHSFMDKINEKIRLINNKE